MHSYWRHNFTRENGRTYSLLSFYFCFGSIYRALECDQLQAGLWVSSSRECRSAIAWNLLILWVFREILMILIRICQTFEFCRAYFLRLLKSFTFFPNVLLINRVFLPKEEKMLNFEVSLNWTLILFALEIQYVSRIEYFSQKINLNLL